MVEQDLVALVVVGSPNGSVSYTVRPVPPEIAVDMEKGQYVLRTEERVKPREIAKVHGLYPFSTKVGGVMGIYDRTDHEHLTQMIRDALYSELERQPDRSGGWD